jgi:uncharacterized protein YybS (DUF2232 family)
MQLSSIVLIAILIIGVLALVWLLDDGIIGLFDSSDDWGPE